MLSVKKYALAGVLSLSLVGLGVSGAAAAPPIVQPSLVNGAASWTLARYVPHKRIVVRRHTPLRRRYVRRRYYGPGPGVALGLFGAALGAISGAYYYPDYYYYDYPGYWGPTYYGPAYYGGAYGGARFHGYGGARGGRGGHGGAHRP